MSTPTRNVTKRQAISLHKWPCDGVARFNVSKYDGVAVPYSLAYEAVFTQSGSTMDEKGKRTYSREALRRIAHLNERYTRIACQFINVSVNQNLAAAMLINAAKPSPEPDQKEPDVTIPRLHALEPGPVEERAETG